MNLILSRIAALDAKVSSVQRQIGLTSMDIDNLKQQGDEMASSLDNLKTAVANVTTVVGSAITLIQGLKAKLDAAIAALPDQTALDALSTELGTDAQSLADAVSANTPTP